MKGFIPVPAADFANALSPVGFVPTVVNHEVVYEKTLASAPAFKVRVFTSLSAGATECREAGADAIRVCVVYTAPNGKTYGVGKSTRVNRTGWPTEVIKRMRYRVAEMTTLAIEYSKVPPCECGSPRWPDSGRCIAKCWAKGAPVSVPGLPKGHGWKSSYKPAWKKLPYGWKNNEDVGHDYGPDGD